MLDCEGRVVAVVANLITRTITSQFGVIRVSTAWQSSKRRVHTHSGAEGFVLAGVSAGD